MRPITRPVIARQLANEEDEKESIRFLTKILGDICVKSNFNSKVMPEIELLPEPVRLELISSIKKTIDDKIYSFQWGCVYSSAEGNDPFRYGNAIEKLTEIKANIR
jgi:hypothetical protein